MEGKIAGKRTHLQVVHIVVSKDVEGGVVEKVDETSDSYDRERLNGKNGENEGGEY